MRIGLKLSTCHTVRLNPHHNRASPLLYSPLIQARPSALLPQRPPKLSFLIWFLLCIWYRPSSTSQQSDHNCRSIVMVRVGILGRGILGSSVSKCRHMDLMTRRGRRVDYVKS
uniref:Uncharacterized protein n=1 Tax=Arundo donax TaxID=35708 RepID=A0A0A9F6J6_ARUDO